MVKFFNIEVREIIGNKILEKFNYNKFKAVKSIFFNKKHENLEVCILMILK